MANEVITRVSADASGFEAGMERVKKASKGFVVDQDATARQFEASQKGMAASTTLVSRALEEAVSRGSAASARQVNAAVKRFERMASAAGKTRVELLRTTAAQLGIAETMEPLISKIEAGTRAMHHLGAGSAGARRELFVLAHEASQGSWKNFVGSLMVLGERIDVLPLVCGPAGIALGALGAAAYVAYHAIHTLSEQQAELDRAMTLTGNFATLTQGRLLAYAETISRRVGVSADDARQALLELAKSGRVAGADLLQVAESVASYAKVSGQSVAEVAHQFEQSYGNASAAAQKWTESHHDLTRAQIEQIRVTEQAGDKAGAWARFVQAASQSARKAVLTDNRAMADSYETLGQRWARFWREVSGKGDALTKLQDEIAAKRGMLADADANPFGLNTDAIEKQIAALERRKEALLDQASTSDAQKKRVDTFASLMSFHDDEMRSVRTWKEKLDDANASARAASAAIMSVAKAAGKSGEELRALGQRLDADLKKTIAHNETLYRAHASKAHGEDGAARYMERLREQGAALQAQLATTQKLTNAQKELARFDERMTRLKQASASEEDASLARAAAQIRAQLERNVGLEKALKLQEAMTQLQSRAQHAREGLHEFSESQAERYAQAPGKRDTDSLQHEARANLREIMRRHQRELDHLRQGASAEVLNSDTYRQAVAEIQRSLVGAVAAHERYFATLKQRQDNWKLGMRDGLAEYFKDIQDKAAQASKAVVSTVGKMEDAIAEFVTTGKLGVRELVSSILADLARLALHQTLGSVVQGLLGANGADVPAMLSSSGALSSTASVAQQHGALAATHANHLSHFAPSGPARLAAPVDARAARSEVNMDIHHHGGGELQASDLQELRTLVSAFVDQRMAQRMRGQGGGGYNQSLGLI